MQKRKIVKIIIVAIIILLTLYFGYLLWQKQTTASLNVKSQYNLITIKKPTGQIMAQGQNNINAKLSEGDYIIVIDANVPNKASQTITVKRGQTYNLTIEPPSTLNSDVVTKSNIKGLYANGSSLTYYTDTGKMINLTSNGIETLQMPVPYTVKLYDSYSGYVVDINKKLHKIDNKNIIALDLPTDLDLTNYKVDLSSTNQLIVYDQQSVYIYVNGFKLLYKSPDKNTLITSASINNDLFINQETIDNDTKKSTVKAIDTNNNLLKESSFLSYFSKYRGEADQDKKTDNIVLKASPKGEYLAIFNNENTSIYDKDLNLKTKVPNKYIRDFTWLDEATYYFSDGEKIYKQNIDGGESIAITNSVYNKNISHIVPKDDYIYYMSYDAKNDPMIQKVNTQGNLKTKNYDGELIINSLPNQIGDCSYNFVNYTKNTIYIDGNYETCYSNLKTLLNNININISNIDIK